jgi:hypothetical protein
MISWNVPPDTKPRFASYISRSDPTAAPARPEYRSLRRTASAHSEVVSRGVSAVELAEWAWVLGSALLVLRMMACLGMLVVKVNRAKPFTEEPDGKLMLDPSGTVPVTVWWGQHEILLPPQAREWSSARLNAVLRHERAHIARLDWWWNLCGQLACAIVWPNPLVWLIHSQTRSLAELAADDLVLGSGIPPSAYAQDLLHIAVEGYPRLESLSLPMATRPQLSRRIDMILNQKQRRGTASLAAIGGVALLQACLVTGLSNWALVQEQADNKREKNVSKQGPTDTKGAVETLVFVKMYLVDADTGSDTLASKARGQGVQVVQVSSKELSKVLEERHGKLLSSPVVHTVIPWLESGGRVRISPKDIVLRQDVPASGIASQVQYIEGLKVEPGMISFELDVAKSGSNTHTTYVSTLSYGQDTLSSLVKESRTSCLLGPVVDSKRILIAHTFKERPANR